MQRKPVPELLAPAGSLDAVRAAVANGADAVYLGADRFNARDEGAQLTMDEVEQACLIAHARGARIYLTLNILIKPHEMVDALLHLGDAIDRGVDAAIVQDVGLIRLIQRVYPGFEVHGSTQMTVHDASGARVMKNLGIERVVLARENTIDDVRAIRAAVPDIGLETFVHGALCISYSGQCYMSGMISERSANRGSCAQSCRKDYTLTNVTSGETLDTGFLISAKDLAAHDHLFDIAEAGVGCLKVEGRKKKPEYVATVTKSYRDFLDRVARGEWTAAPTTEETAPLVQIYSRGFTGGMYGGRSGRSYITRAQPDNRGEELGVVAGRQGSELLIEVRSPVSVGDGLGFESPEGPKLGSTGFTIDAVRTIATRGGVHRQAVRTRQHVPAGWVVVRSSHAALLERARSSYAALSAEKRMRRIPLDVRVFGSAGGTLKLVVTAEGESITVVSEARLSPAKNRALDMATLREQLGRLGETLFVLKAVDISGLEGGLFFPVSELNHLRRQATGELLLRRNWAMDARLAERRERIEREVAEVRRVPVREAASTRPFTLSATVWRTEDAREAAASGASEVVFDPFLRHPFPPVTRVRALAESLQAEGVTLRLRTPTIVRPEERAHVQKWLDLGLPMVSGHLGLVAELAGAGRDVVADYAVNCFNTHTAAELFRLGASRIVSSVELTVGEIESLVAPWDGNGFDVFVYGRPEGMTIEHCVLSAAFDRVATTCRDLCVKAHTNVEITDPAGYTFPVATDSACRNRLLHSRPIDGSEFLPRLWSAGLRNFGLVFNVPGDDVSGVVRRYRAAFESIAAGQSFSADDVRRPLNGQFTRGHFVRAV